MALFTSLLFWFILGFLFGWFFGYKISGAEIMSIASTYYAKGAEYGAQQAISAVNAEIDQRTKETTEDDDHNNTYSKRVGFNQTL